MQRSGRQHVNRYQTLLRPAWNEFHTPLSLIWEREREKERESRKRLVLVRSELLGQFVKTLTAVYMYSR